MNDLLGVAEYEIGGKLVFKDFHTNFTYKVGGCGNFGSTLEYKILLL